MSTGSHRPAVQSSDAAGAPLDIDSLPLRKLLAGCIENLRSTYRESDGLFPYATRSVDGRHVSDYGHPQTVRYTINSLLGLAEAARAGTDELTISEVGAMAGTFLRHQLKGVENAADLGLLTLLAADYLDTEEIAESVVRRMRHTVADDARGLDLQDLCWTIWGSTAAARAGLRGAEEVARATAGVVEERFLDLGTGLPRHSPSRYRRNIVSFGGLTYYLRALHELERSFDERRWSDAFRLGVEQALRLQGPKGEWPWMIDVRTGTSFDPYPVFSVHQDSMAMLFLLPAFDAGVLGAGRAIASSVAWGFGENELGTPFYRWDPFFAMRSIERVERAPRLRRYVRGLLHRSGSRPAAFGRGSVRVNPECRSYHLGWILYAWAQRVADAPTTAERG